MEPKIISLPEVTVIGKGIRTTNENGRSIMEQAALWQQFFSDQFLKDVSCLASPGATLGVYIEYEKDATKPYTYLVGAAVDNIQDIPDGLYLKILPASQYAVFTSPRGPVMQIVAETWQRIWIWSDQNADSRYRRSFTGDFEVYDERCNDPDNAQVDIYIAVR